MNNDILSKNTDTIKCVDIFYLIITTLFFIGVLILAIINFNPSQLYDLSMPRNSQGKHCQTINNITNTTAPFLQILGPSISDRICTASCQQSTPNMQLGGLCYSSRVQSILKQTKQYQQYIQSKINTLNRFKIIAFTLFISIVFAILINIMGICINRCCNTRIYGNLLILLSIVSGISMLYFLYSKIMFAIWLTLCIIFSLYMVYVFIWKIVRSNQLTNLQTETNKQIPNKILTKLFITILITVLTIGFICLLLFEYLSFISSSQYYNWVSPALYAEVTGITYKQILVIVQTVYLISFTTTLYQYFIGGLNSNNLGLSTAFNSLICGNLGSLCKLAIIRILFFIPIFILTLIKPLQTDKCSNACHCLCGYLLNLSRKYSLPVLSYQSAIKQSLDLSLAANRIHYQTHINNLQHSSAYIQRIAILVLLSCVSIACVLFCAAYLNLGISLITLELGVGLTIWIGNYFASTEIYQKEGYLVRKVCEANRI